MPKARKKTRHHNVGPISKRKMKNQEQQTSDPSLDMGIEQRPYDEFQDLIKDMSPNQVEDMFLRLSGVQKNQIQIAQSDARTNDPSAWGWDVFNGYKQREGNNATLNKVREAKLKAIQSSTSLDLTSGYNHNCQFEDIQGNKGKVVQPYQKEQSGYSFRSFLPAFFPFSFLHPSLSKGADALPNNIPFITLKDELEGHIEEGDVKKIKRLLPKDADIEKQALEEVRTCEDLFDLLEKKRLFDANNLCFLQILLNHHFGKRHKTLNLICEYVNASKDSPLFAAKIKKHQCNRFKYLELKIKGDPKHFYLSDVEKYRTKLAAMLSLEPYNVRFEAMNEGCILLVFMIPSTSVAQMNHAALCNDDRFKLSVMGIVGVHIQGGDYIPIKGMTAISDKDLYSTILELGPDGMRHLYLQLGIWDKEREKAEASANTDDAELRALAVLSDWKQRLGSKATREALFEAKEKVTPSSTSGMSAISDKDLYDMIWELGPNGMKHLYHHLGIRDEDREKAEASANTDDTVLRVLAVLSDWKKRLGFQATPEALFAAKEKVTGGSVFDLQTCQQELIDIYKSQMCRVNLLPWFEEETRDMDDIYVSLELENQNKVLHNNEDLVLIRRPDGTFAKRILVTGTVGLGKSILMAKLAYTWAQRDPASPLYKYELVFILSFREIREGCNVIDAIFQQILANDTSISKLALEKYIHSNPNVLFLMDGFDEYFAENLDIIYGQIDEMLNFKNLRETCVVISSRPHKYLGKCQSLYTTVTLTGFSNQNIELYLYKFFYNNSELIRGLSRKLSESDKLKSLSHIPVILMLICLLWEDSQSLPNTLSELYAEFIKFLWRIYCHKYNTESQDDEDSLKHCLINLGKIAFDGLMPRGATCHEQFVFRETDFLGSLETGCQVGLLTKERLRSKLTVSSAVTFLHKSLQEYCASYYLACLPDDQFDYALQRIDTVDKVQNKVEILQFLCGISDGDHVARTIHHVIQVYLAKITKDDIVTTETLAYVHDTSIKPVLLLLRESDFPSYETLTESLRSLLSAGKVLLIGSRTLEWHSFVQSSLAPILNQVQSVRFKDTPLDVISQTLSNMTNVDVVEIVSEFITTEDSMYKLGLCTSRLQNLSKLILTGSVIRKHPNITPIMSPINSHCQFQLRAFTLNKVECNSEILCHLLAIQHQLRCLNLTTVKLSNDNIESVLDAIKAPLNELTIVQHVHVGNAIKHTRHILPHLHYLDLGFNGLKESDIFLLGQFLSTAKHLSCLDLSSNKVGKAVHKLGCVIPQLTRLRLHNAHLQKEDILILSEFLKEARCLTYLDLSSNYVGRAGTSLCESLKSCSDLKELRLLNTGLKLTEEEVRELSGNLSDLTICV